MKSQAALKKQFLLEAEKIFLTNRVEGYSKRIRTHYRFIAPSKKEYRFQFLWDTAFHAIVLSHIDLEWAKEEIKNILKAQWQDGFMPHIIFWSGRFLPHWAIIESKISFLPPFTSAITQPPLLAVAVEQIYKKGPDVKFLEETVYKLIDYHNWLLKYRDPNQDGLISIISPNESGLDELPTFQYALGYYKNNPVKLHYVFRKPDILNQRYNFQSRRILKKDYFNVEDLAFNTIFIEACRSLSRLCRALSDKKNEKYFADVSNKALQSMIKKCWDEKDGIFYTVFSKYQKKARVKTIESLLPLFLDGLAQKYVKRLVQEHLLNPQEFWTEYPVPSVAKSELYYYPKQPPVHHLKFLWRGPTWINTNWLIVKGLRKHGYRDIADEIVRRTVKMIQKSGFREYYNPESGEGYSHHNFGWSTLICDLL